MNTNNFGAYILTALVAGAAFGAVAGVLMAPESGRESRRKMSQWLKERREKGQVELRARKEQVAAVIEAGRKAYNESEKALV